MDQICTARTAALCSPSETTTTLHCSETAPPTYTCAVQSLAALTGSHDTCCWYRLGCLKLAQLMPDKQWTVRLMEGSFDTIGKHHAVQPVGFSAMYSILVAVRVSTIPAQAWETYQS